MLKNKSNLYRMRKFEKMMREIADARPELKYESLSQGLIQNLRRNDSSASMLVFGYHFPLNNAASANVANDKAAACSILNLHNVPCVNHKVFISPLIQFSSYAHQEGTMPALSSMLLENSPKGLVIKPKTGTSGMNTFRVKTQLQLEQAWLRLLQNGRDFVACPFLELEDEFRCILLDGELQLCYRKKRAEVVGDGKRTISELRAEYERHTNTKLKVEAGELKDGKEKYARNRVPAVGERLLLEWRHNLSCGALADVTVPNDIIQKHLLPLARQCMNALELRFASVDIVTIKCSETGENKYIILEVNSGVMMEGFVRQHPEKWEHCKNIYAKAVDSYFHDQDKLAAKTPKRKASSEFKTNSQLSQLKI
eukprot:g5171.t1